MLQPVDLAGPPEAAVCDAERDLREIVGRMRRRKASGDFEYVRDVAYLMGLAGVDHFRPDVPGEG
jgi:hypothetical protein